MVYKTHKKHNICRFYILILILYSYIRRFYRLLEKLLKICISFTTKMMVMQQASRKKNEEFKETR